MARGRRRYLTAAEKEAAAKEAAEKSKRDLETAQPSAATPACIANPHRFSVRTNISISLGDFSINMNSDREG